jgi:ribose/xylose/arabinose/galactoside ABC-type transport system permease subunit
MKTSPSVSPTHTGSSRLSELHEVMRRLLQRSEWGLLLALVLVAVLTAVVDKNHSYWSNPEPSVEDILRQVSVLGIYTLGAALVIIAGGIDLSSGSVIAFSGTICASLMLLLAPDEVRDSLPLSKGVLLVAAAGALLAGLLIGSLHAWLITVIGLPPFVATLATLVGLRSLGRALVEYVTAQQLGHLSTQIEISDDRFRDWTTSVPLRVYLFLALAGLVWLLLSRTVTGRHLYALGGNENAARLSGIQTDRLKWLAYCLSALLSSIAGVILIGEQSVAEPQTLGRGYELNAIAAAVVGGCSLRGGIGTIPGTVLGALFLRTVMDGVTKVIKSGADTYEGLIVGAVVVVAVAFTQLREAAQRGKRFLPGALGLVTAVNLSLLAGLLAVLMKGAEDAAKARSIGGGTAAITLVVLLALRFWEGRRAARAIAAGSLAVPGKTTQA